MVGLVVLVGLALTPYVDPDSIGSLRRVDADTLSFLTADLGFPSLAHNVLRLATGTERSVPGTQALNVGLFLVYAAACAAACARAVDARLAPYASFVATLAPAFSRFHEARASVMAAASGALAFALWLRSPRRDVLSVPVIAAIGLATLDNPLCLLWLVLLGWLAAPTGRAWASWIGAGLLLVAGQALPWLTVLGDRSTFYPADDSAFGFLISACLLVAPIEVLRPSPAPELRRWRQAAAVVFVLALLVVLSQRLAAWKIAVWFWPLIVVGGALGTASRATPTRARQIWIFAAMVTLGRTLFDGPIKIGVDQQLFVGVVQGVKTRAAPGEAIVVIPSHHYVELVTSGGLLAPRDVAWPTTALPPWYPGLGEPDGRPVCVPPQGAVSWALVIERPGTEADPMWKQGCSSCDLAEGFWRGGVWRCVSDGTVLPAHQVGAPAPGQPMR